MSSIFLLYICWWLFVEMFDDSCMWDDGATMAQISNCEVASLPGRDAVVQASGVRDSSSKIPKVP